MLDKAITQQILDFVQQKPRTIQEVAHLTQRNWRTAERYVDAIALETGMIASRTFRGGTRGALRIVYWNALEAAKGSAFQERLLEQITRGRRKEDFSPLEIYQFAPAKSREAFIERREFSNDPKLKYDLLMRRSQRQLLSFSGNLSWINLRPEMLLALEALAKRKVNIRILTRIDITSERNVRLALGINKRVGWDAVQVRHCEQPLRAVVIDDEFAMVKEVFTPERSRETKEKTFIFYRIGDNDWVTWLQKVFWRLWNQSVDAQTRMDALETIRRIAR